MVATPMGGLDAAEMFDISPMEREPSMAQKQQNGPTRKIRHYLNLGLVLKGARLESSWSRHGELAIHH